MLKKDTLQSQLLDIFKNTIPGAFEKAMLESYPGSSKKGKERAKKFGETMSEMLSEEWASGIAAAIDYYVKNAQIFGTVITVGSPTTQTAMINSTPVPSINGSVPNTLGIK